MTGTRHPHQDEELAALVMLSRAATDAVHEWTNTARNCELDRRYDATDGDMDSSLGLAPVGLVESTGLDLPRSTQDVANCFRVLHRLQHHRRLRAMLHRQRANAE